MSETTIDHRGRVVIPKEIRDNMQLKEGIILKVEKRDKEIIIRPARKTKKSIKEFYAQDPERTGDIKWPTPEEIKNIWE